MLSLRSASFRDRCASQAQHILRLICLSLRHGERNYFLEGKQLVIRSWCRQCFGITRDAVAFIKPGTEIDQFAAFRAEGSPALLTGPCHGIAAGRAADCLCLVGCHLRLDYATSQFEFHILVGLPGSFFVGGKFQKACSETVASTAQLGKIGEPRW